MKTNKFYTALTIIMVVLFALALNASALEMNLGHASFDNPPEVVLSESTNSALSNPDFEEEAYIDDIPFDTESISKACCYQQALSESYVNEDELYVDDIPFNTAEVALKISYQSALEVEFEPTDEAYIDDIPFDTYSITQSYIQSHYAYNK